MIETVCRVWLTAGITAYTMWELSSLLSLETFDFIEAELVYFCVVVIAAPLTFPVGMIALAMDIYMTLKERE